MCLICHDCLWFRYLLTNKAISRTSPNLKKNTIPITYRDVLKSFLHIKIHFGDHRSQKVKSDGQILLWLGAICQFGWYDYTHSQIWHYSISYLLTCEVDLFEILEIMAQMGLIFFSHKPTKATSDCILNYLKKVIPLKKI